MANKNSGFPYSREMKENGGYFLDVLNNTLHMTPEFHKKSNLYGTKECEIVDTLTLRSNLNPTIKVHTQKRAARISLQMMEVFISKMPNAEENFKEFKRVCLKSKIAKNPHKEVLSWFEKTFPYYKSLKVEQDGKVVWNALDEYSKALKEHEERKNGTIIPMPQAASADYGEAVNE